LSHGLVLQQFLYNSDPTLSVAILSKVMCGRRIMMAHLAVHLFFCFCIWLHLGGHLPARAAAAAMIDSIFNDAFQSWEMSEKDPSFLS
jgi:hypothetical protein